ncbi:MAG: hypothetical protein M3Q19_14635 [Pseudomonadota bacterium]|nr:hypothetical protein [Pseudomonadota bacterium]
MNIKLVVAALLAASLAACAPIQSKPYVSQPVGQSLRVGVGGVIVHVDRKRNLENAFGKSDVFGRKTYEGFSELRFMGVQNGQVAIRRVDVAVYNDETTLSRSGIYIPNNSTATTTGTVGTVPFMATTNVSGPGTYIPPRPANVSVSAPSLVDFLAPIGHPLPFEGVTVTITAADPVSVSYSIQAE